MSAFFESLFQMWRCLRHEAEPSYHEPVKQTLVLAAMLMIGSMLTAQSLDEREVIGVLQRLFDSMAAHDEAAIAGTMLPDARIMSVRDQAEPNGISAGEMARRIASTKIPVVERFTSTPKVSVRGRIAQLWGEYEFLRDGKLSHCGVDSALLMKTASGWKISALSYTVETAGCGEPRK